MKQKVLVFAVAREMMQSDSIEIETGGQELTAAAFLALIGESFPELASIVSACRLAVDDCYVASDHVIPPGAELALIPPVSGG